MASTVVIASSFLIIGTSTMPNENIAAIAIAKSDMPTIIADLRVEMLLSWGVILLVFILPLI